MITKTNETKNVQYAFLSELVNSQSSAAIYLINGIKLTGTLEAFDDEVILLHDKYSNDDKHKQIIFKAAISTISERVDMG